MVYGTAVLRPHLVVHLVFLLGVTTLLEHVASFEICVGVNNNVEIGSSPIAALLALLDLSLVRMLEYPIAGNVVPLPTNILAYSAQDVFVSDARALQECCQVVRAKVPVRATMAFTASWGVLCEDLLTGERRVAPATPICVPANISVRMSDIVPILLVEGVISNPVEGLSPEENAVFHAQAKTFEK